MKRKQIEALWRATSVEYRQRALEWNYYQGKFAAFEEALSVATTKAIEALLDGAKAVVTSSQEEEAFRNGRVSGFEAVLALEEAS